MDSNPDAIVQQGSPECLRFGMNTYDPFVRCPTRLLESLLQARLSGTQWKILMWVLRATYGWNREWTPFSWYGIAKQVHLDRAGLLRAGQQLLQLGILNRQGHQIGIECDAAKWSRRLAPQWRERSREMIDVDADGCHRLAMTNDSASADDGQQNRCRESSLLRRAEDSSKDKFKKYKDSEKQLPLAGSARPIPNKYDRLSQN
jgi:phage replication O-like protein O